MGLLAGLAVAMEDRNLTGVEVDKGEDGCTLRVGKPSGMVLFGEVVEERGGVVICGGLVYCPMLELGRGKVRVEPEGGAGTRRKLPP